MSLEFWEPAELSSSPQLRDQGRGYSGWASQGALAELWEATQGSAHGHRQGTKRAREAQG